MNAMRDEMYPEVDPNKKSAKDLWEERYAGDKYLFGKEPVLSLKNHLSFLRKGKAIDIAMGEGRNAVYLAQNGFQVEGVDGSAKAVEKAKALAAEKGVQIDAKPQNLDFFLMPLMKFDTLLMTYYRPQARFFNEIRRGLVQGGTCLIEAYTVDQAKHHPNNPLIDFDQCYKPNEVLQLLKDFHILFYKEMKEGDSYLVQAIAEKRQK
jgi:SAM-dependent methyltransferase